MEEFYHFTAKRFLDSIRRNGLTEGRMLKSFKPIQFLNNKQWITKNASFEQGWSVGTGRLPYKRNEVRLTLKIPMEKMENCKPWSQMKFLVPDVAFDLEDDPSADPENWWIYQGVISPKWIADVAFNENYK